MKDQQGSAAQQQQTTGGTTKGSKRLSAEDKVVICLSLLFILGSIPLYLFGFPSIVISIFLAAGLTAVIYRFLGGIQISSVAVSFGKFGGAAALIYVFAVWINGTNQLEPQRRFHLTSDDAIVGEWQWDVVGPSASWQGFLQFTKPNGKLIFSGKEYNFEKTPDGSRNTLLLEMTNGTASLINGTNLTLESDVMDYQNGRKFHWKSEAPFNITPAFRGELRPQKPDDPNLESKPWGMLIYKKR